MKSIFDETTLAGMKLKNRIFRSATWVGLCNPDGSLKEEIFQIYQELAKGGVGVIVTELTDVSQFNTAMGDNMRLYSDDLIHDYKKLVDVVHKQNVKIIPQLNIYQYARTTSPHEIIDIDDLTLTDIEDIKRLYTEAAVRTRECGFDAIQLHLAYGWLLYRFLNPMCNHRSDNYGGNLENRTRIISEIIQEIKKQVPDIPICAKFSFYPDYKKIGCQQILFKHAKPINNFGMEVYDVEECSEICRILYNKGLDFIEILGDHSAFEKGNDYPSCYLPLAKDVQKKCAIPIILTGITWTSI